MVSDPEHPDRGRHGPRPESNRGRSTGSRRHRSHTLKLRGGFTAADFSDVDRTGYSTISGWLKIQAGKLTVERLKIKAP